MKELIKYSGVLLVLVGVLFLVVYAISAPYNWLLVVGIALEVVGIIAYIIINRYIE